MITTLCMDKRLWQKHRTSQHVHNQLDRACRLFSNVIGAQVTRILDERFAHGSCLKSESVNGRQTTQWPIEKVQKDKQRSTKHTHKTKDCVTRPPLKTGGELKYSTSVFFIIFRCIPLYEFYMCIFHLSISQYISNDIITIIHQNLLFQFHFKTVEKLYIGGRVYRST
jgi:hypothetical protein